MKFGNLLGGFLLALPTLLVASAVPASNVDLTASSGGEALILTDGDASNYTSQTYVETSNAIERRQTATDIYNEVSDMLVEVWIWAISQGGSTNDKRSRFTREVVARGRRQFRQYNWVLCSTRHSTNWQGTQKVDWEWRQFRFSSEYNGGSWTIYDVNWAKAGTFQRHGDGGFINWAWSGVTNYVSPGGETIEFRAP